MLILINRVIFPSFGVLWLCEIAILVVINLKQVIYNLIPGGKIAHFFSYFNFTYLIFL